MVPSVSTTMSNRPYLLFVSKSRSPLTPLDKGEEYSLKVPLLKGDLGGSELGEQRKIQKFLGLT